MLTMAKPCTALKQVLLAARLDVDSWRYSIVGTSTDAVDGTAMYSILPTSQIVGTQNADDGTAIYSIPTSSESSGPSPRLGESMPAQPKAQTSTKHSKLKT